MEAVGHSTTVELNAPDLVSYYNDTMGSVLDKHAPLKQASLAVKARAPWYNREIACAKKERRAAEITWRLTKLTVHSEMFKAKRNHVNALMQKAKSTFYNTKVQECEGDQKALFRVINKLLHRTDDLAEANCPSAQEMSDFFHEKIERIWHELQTNLNDEPFTHDNDDASQTPPPELSQLQPVTNDEVQKIVLSMSSASCQLDPLPTQFVKQHIRTLSQLLTKIINSSLQSGVVPSALKRALVIPRLKKTKS